MEHFLWGIEFRSDLCRAFGSPEPEWLVAMFAKELLSPQLTKGNLTASSSISVTVQKRQIPYPQSTPDKVSLSGPAEYNPALQLLSPRSHFHL